MDAEGPPLMMEQQASEPHLRESREEKSVPTLIEHYYHLCVMAQLCIISRHLQNCVKTHV